MSLVAGEAPLEGGPSTQVDTPRTARRRLPRRRPRVQPQLRERTADGQDDRIDGSGVSAGQTVELGGVPCVYANRGLRPEQIAESVERPRSERARSSRAFVTGRAALSACPTASDA
jgi:hypothetical protein